MISFSKPLLCSTFLAKLVMIATIGGDRIGGMRYRKSLMKRQTDSIGRISSKNFLRPLIRRGSKANEGSISSNWMTCSKQQKMLRRKFSKFVLAERAAIRDRSSWWINSRPSLDDDKRLQFSLDYRIFWIRRFLPFGLSKLQIFFTNICSKFSSSSCR